MITLIGSLLGFGTSFVPKILDYFNAKREHAARLDEMRLQMELAEKNANIQVRLLDKQAGIAETKALYDSQATMPSGGFIGGLRGSVRPVVTYLFVGLFIAVKIAVLAKMMAMGDGWEEAVIVLWDDATAGMMSAILAFWFGSRSVDKYVGRKND